MKYILSITLFFVLSFSLSAQHITYGLTAGFTGGTPIGKAPDGASGTPGGGFEGGLFARYDINEKWGIRGDLLYTQKGAKFVTPVDDYIIEEFPLEIKINDEVYEYIITAIFDGTITGSFDNEYLEFSAGLFYKFNNKWSLNGGPYLAYLIEGSNVVFANGTAGVAEDIEVNDFRLDQTNFLRKIHHGFHIGGYYETIYGVNLGLKATTGMTSIYDDSYTYSPGTVRNLYLTASVGYRFGSVGL